MKNLLVGFLFLAAISPLCAQGQKTPAKQRKSVPGNLQGVVVKGNKATLKPGFEFVRKSDNEVAVQKKKKKNPPDGPKDPSIETATFRCGCSSGRGSCSIATQGTNLFCDKNGCDNCSLTVTKTVF